MTPDQERTRLLAATDRNLNRLRELKDILFPEHASTLPLSGLVQAQPGVLLFKGGRDA